MKMSKTTCPHSLQYETLYLNNELGEILVNDPEHHLYSCPDCQKFISDLDAMYSSILNETSYPITNSLLDFVCKVSPYSSLKGLFSCTPEHKNKDKHHKTYQMQDIFVQTSFDNKIQFNDYKQTMQQYPLSVRILTDPAIECVLLFFWSKSQIDFTKWRLTIPGIISDYRISSSGTVIIPGKEIKDIQNKSLHLQKYIKPVSPKMVNKIQECIQA